MPRNDNLIKNGHTSFGDLLKSILYQYDNNIFEVLSFDDDEIFTDPFFYAMFNLNESNHFQEKENRRLMINSILFGYSHMPEYKALGVEISTDSCGRFYIPRKGWFLTTLINENIFIIEANNNIILKHNDNIIEYSFEPTKFIKNSSIEVMKYRHPLFSQFYPNEIYNNINFEGANEKHLSNLEKAFDILEKHCNSVFNTIRNVLKRVVLFDISPEWTNSFMSRSAYGAAFFNCYQEEYDEIFLIEDIVHQTGHVIFEALIFDRESIFKVDHNTILESNEFEDRTIEVFFHALYTYSLILYSLTSCHKSNIFEGLKVKELEGRILYTIIKARHDLETITNEKAHQYFTELGLEIFTDIKEKIQGLSKDYANLNELYTLKNQPYNFTLSIFMEENTFASKNN